MDVHGFDASDLIYNNLDHLFVHAYVLSTIFAKAGMHFEMDIMGCWGSLSTASHIDKRFTTTKKNRADKKNHFTFTFGKINNQKNEMK